MKTTKCYRYQILDDPIGNLKHVLLSAQTPNIDELKLIWNASSGHCNKHNSQCAMWRIHSGLDTDSQESIKSRISNIKNILYRGTW